MRWMCNGLALLCVTALLAGVYGCGGPAGRTEDGKLRVVVSIPPQGWLIQQIAGDLAHVTVLVPPGSDPHTYQPTDAQATLVSQAAVYFRIGVQPEYSPWFSRLSKSLNTVDTRKGIELLAMEDHHHHHHDHDHDHHHHHDDDEKDPHIWTSPRLLKVQAQTVADELMRLDPDHADTYRANLAKLHEQLDKLDREITAILEPVKGKAFFVFHPAWAYFAHDYGLKQIAIEQRGLEPSDAELTKVIGEAREHQARVVFVQPEVAGFSAEAVARAISGRVDSLDPLAPDVAENLLASAKRIAASFE